MPAAKKKLPPTEVPPFSTPTLRGDADCVNEIAKIAEVGRRLDAAKAQLEADTQKIAKDAAPALMALQQEHDARILALRFYCEGQRKRLTDNGASKTISFATGSVSWRSLPASVSIKGKVDDLIEAIRRNGNAALLFLRQKTEIDKESMLRYPDLARSFKGVTVKSAGEEFYVEPLEVDINTAVRP